MQIYGLQDLAALPEKLTSLAITALGEGEKLTDRELKGLDRLTALRSLTLRVGHLTAKGLESLAKRAALRCWGLSGGALPDAAFASLASLPLEALSLVNLEAITAKGVAPLLQGALQELTIRDCAKLVPGGLAKVLGGLRSLRRLIISSTMLSEDLMVAIAALPALTQLDVVATYQSTSKSVAISPEKIYAPLAASKSLERLHADRVLSAAEAKALAECASLQTVWLKISGAKDITAAGPLKKKSLVISFTGPEVATDALLEALAKGLPGIEELMLDPGAYASLGQKFGASGLAAVATLKKLKKLNLNRNFSLKNDAIDQLAGHQSLTSLDLGGCAKLTGGIATTLTSMPSLAYLSTRYCKFTDGTLKKLAALPLQKIDFSSTKIGDKGITALTGAKSLRALGAAHYINTISDVSLQALSKLSLEDLFLDISGVSVAGFQALAKIKTLRRVYLSSKTPLEDAWLEALAATSSLEVLSISIYTDTSKLTDAGIKALSAAKSLLVVDIPKINTNPEERHTLSRECGFFLMSAGNPLFYTEAALSCGWSLEPSWEE